MKPQHPSVVEALALVREHRAALISVCGQMLGPSARMYTNDLFAIGAAKRAISLVDGFCPIVETWNLSCARAMLRLQIDTAIRFAAVTLVKDQQQFVSAILRNERIDKMKDRNGERLTDAHLVRTFSVQVPWLKDVYERTSGYVHLSGQYIHSAVRSTDDGSRTISFAISSVDDHFPESSWLEVVECFDESLKLFIGTLEQWVEAKTRRTAAE